MLWFGNVLWPSLILCTVLYLLDYYLTIAGARVYRAGAQQTIIFEGSYELTPAFQRDVDQLRWVSGRFIWSLARLLVFLSLTWWLASQAEIPQLFSFCLGVFVGVQLAVQKRHLQNLFLFRAITKPGAADGQIKYSRALILKQSAVEMFAFAALFALLSLFTWNLFVLGSATGCLSVAIRHLIMARKAPSSAVAAVA